MTRVRPAILAIAMACAAAGAVALKPAVRMSDDRPHFTLDKSIPYAFGDWSVDTDVSPIAVSPDVKAQLDIYYDQTLSRTYSNTQSKQRVMLSIAYGAFQTRALQVHRPDICYSAQGFSVASQGRVKIRALNTEINATNLVATKGQRVEPITYWIRIGDRTVYGGIAQFWNRIAFGLQGYIPDGTLVRVSMIQEDLPNAYLINASFIDALLRNVDPVTRRNLIGS